MQDAVSGGEIDRRVTLLLLAICAIAAATGAWVNGARARPELTMATGVLVILTLLTWRIPATLQAARIALLVVGVLAVHGRVALALYSGLESGGLESKLAPLGPWVILISGLAIVLSKGRGGTILALLLWAVTSVAVILFLALNTWPLSARMRLELLNQYILAHAAFLAVMTYWAGLRSELSRSASQMAALSNQARTDVLTGVGNRRAGEELLAGLVEGCRTRGGRLGVLLFDLDRFKEINDRHGHPAGDLVIRGAADVARRVVRPGDYVFRWGGEEFLVVARGADLGMTGRIAERLRDAYERGEFHPADHLTVSVGVSTFEPGDDLVALIGRADNALYEAKVAGRNCVRTSVRAVISEASPAAALELEPES